MQKPSWLHANVNLTSLIALLGVGYAVVNSSTTMQNELAALKQDRIERSAAVDQSFDRVDDRLAAIEKRFAENNIPYRMTEVERRQGMQDQRMDSIMDRFANQLDAIRKDVGAVGTKVEVLTQKIDSLSPTPSPRRTGVERRAEIDTTP